MPRLLLLAVVILTALAAGSGQTGEPSAGTDVYVFWANGCPHCERALAFLGRLESEEPSIRVHRLEITRNPFHRDVFGKIAELHRIADPVVPFIVIGDRVFAGYYDDTSTGTELRAAAFVCLTSRCADRVRPVLSGEPPLVGDERPAPSPGRRLPETIRLPIIGSIATRHLSLPALTVVLGAADGFNPCAMWTLVFLMGLLVGMRNKRRRWALGVTFLAASAFVYYLIMAAWLNVLLFVGMVIWIRVGIGVVALSAGAFTLREFFLNPAQVCDLAASERHQRVFAKLRALVSEPSLAIAATGIVLLAFAVNVVELLCSAGIPAVYTQVLALSDLPVWDYHAYLLLYILVFMLDDLLVFFTAMATLEVTGLTGRYVHWANLVGAVALLILGALIILRPEWLMFG
ncbi:MAG: hypothetical protein HY914_09295 [Desulfomonile tiedjei]|nr:hypothetical protein [Desulfomonile tiedjei]